MSLEKCPKCRYKLYGEYKYCPNCGRVLNPNEKEAAEDAELDEAIKLYDIRSYDEASKIIHEVAQEGNPRAITMVGGENASGVDGHYSFGWAFNYYERAAAQGYTPAIRAMGECYEYGRGVSWDWQQAVEWYQKAAELGDIHAIYNIGRLYEKGGNGIEQNLTQAFSWYLKAGERGDSGATYKLGQFYESGTGVETDWPKAVYWYEKSIKLYGNDGKKRLEEMMQKGCKEAELALENLNK